MQPYDYRLNPVPQDLTSGLKQGVMLSQIMNSAKKEQAAAQSQAAMQADLARLAGNRNATADDYRSMMTKYPTMAENLKRSVDVLNEDQKKNTINEASQIYSAVSSGRPDVAVGILERKKEAAINAGNKAEAQKTDIMLQLVKTNPEAAKTSTALLLSTADPEKFADIYTKLQDSEMAKELQVGKTDKQLADIELTKAQTRKINSEVSSILGDSPIKLTKDGEKLVNESVNKQVKFDGLSREYKGISDKITKELSKAGLTAKGSEYLKRIWGDEDSKTKLRQDYTRLRNTAVLDMLPPGVASDKDIEIAMSAFPDATANPELIASFMAGMAKMQKYAAQIEGEKAEWVSKVGNLSQPNRDIEIQGKTVKAGTRFNDYIKDKIGENADESQTDGGQEKTIVETRVLPDGRQIVQYSDGTKGII